MTTKKKDILETINHIKKIFPFSDSTDNDREEYIDLKQNSHLNIAYNVCEYLKKGSTVLDFGSGPLDKTSIIKKLGYECYAIDDLADDWHLKDDNKSKIFQFAKKLEIPLYSSIDELTLSHPGIKFDLILLNDVIEHLHNSPRFIFKELDKLLSDNGYYLITVPNSTNLKKRVKLLFGKTNYVDYKSYFMHDGNYFRGHVREYSKDCLIQLCKYMNYEIIKIKGCHQMLNKLPNFLILPWKFLTYFFSNLSDSYILIAKKLKK
tara:strand:+ start:848 stop:1636 length:789 start_codon:yes stop_codon:yes gene_type:complete